MMPTLIVDTMEFTFPENWFAHKYDDWSFYRNQFSRQDDGISAVDLLVLSDTNAGFLIEVKDYRHPGTIKPSELPQAIASKVLHTLAALLPAKLYANDPDERAMAGRFLACDSLTVMLHIEQPQEHKPVVDVKNLKRELRRRLRAVDRHVKIVSMNTLSDHGVHWTVEKRKIRDHNTPQTCA